LPENGGGWLVANVESDLCLKMVEAGWLPMLSLPLPENGGGWLVPFIEDDSYL
jgi:hypothetical protein